MAMFNDRGSRILFVPTVCVNRAFRSLSLRPSLITNSSNKSTLSHTKLIPLASAAYHSDSESIPKGSDRNYSFDTNGFPSTRARAGPKGALSRAGHTRPTIQWYPGHIAKAERQLRDTLKLVDVILEVRDCRIPRSTTHPNVPDWIGNRPRVVVMNRTDMSPAASLKSWKQHLVKNSTKHDFENPNANQNGNNYSVRFVNSKKGDGIMELKKEVMRLGSHMNDKRVKKGMLKRAVRCVAIGFPNVGKSALINRLVGRKAVKSENRPGVTRSLQWVRIAQDLEMLDTPGIIPMKFVEQPTALRLAFCDDIGQASYDSELVASALLDELRVVSRVSEREYFDADALKQRYSCDMDESISGESLLHAIADSNFKRDRYRAATAILNDFRSGRLGLVSLELPQFKDLMNPDADNSTAADEEHAGQYVHIIEPLLPTDFE
mmetsp:Transcript_325/g.599  ORF Transcript_325/g.599 Transcript_325/m.599 type:complete len:435 (+) Transcript_325:30-1334(+)